MTTSELADKIKHRFVCLIRRHQWKPAEQVIEGATLSWAGTPTRQYGWHYKCSRCGAETYKGGFVIPGDRRLNPKAYNADGWPIDEQGNKLPIADKIINNDEKATCFRCGQQFVPYMNDGELENELCYLCLLSYEEGQLFDREFGDD